MIDTGVDIIAAIGAPNKNITSYNGTLDDTTGAVYLSRIYFDTEEYKYTRYEFDVLSLASDYLKDGYIVDPENSLSDAYQFGLSVRLASIVNHEGYGRYVGVSIKSSNLVFPIFYEYNDDNPMNPNTSYLSNYKKEMITTEGSLAFSSVTNDDWRDGQFLIAFSYLENNSPTIKHFYIKYGLENEFAGESIDVLILDRANLSSTDDIDGYGENIKIYSRAYEYVIATSGAIIDTEIETEQTIYKFFSVSYQVTIEGETTYYQFYEAGETDLYSPPNNTLGLGEFDIGTLATTPTEDWLVYRNIDTAEGEEGEEGEENEENVDIATLETVLNNGSSISMILLNNYSYTATAL
uniref:Uncharacterized protein n=1 Tax=viral metagenome TaxID=1070528 RepID=A0A6C0ACQ1_9ZZZZ